MLLSMALFSSFYGWVIFHCMYVYVYICISHHLYPFICLWTFRLLSCINYYKQWAEGFWRVPHKFYPQPQNQQQDKLWPWLEQRSMILTYNWRCVILTIPGSKHVETGKGLHQERDSTASFIICISRFWSIDDGTKASTKCVR